MSKLIVWKISDGKQGHESQSNGLITALGRYRDVEVCEVSVRVLPNYLGLMLCWILRRKPRVFPSTKPNLIIGAGRRTHLPLLVAKSICGGKTVVLMRPSFPLQMFDLVVVPEHDKVAQQRNALQIKGVLNAIEYVKDKNHCIGLMLIGGESSHYTWDDQRVIEQIQEIVQSDTNIQWVLTTSRRTPNDFLGLLQTQVNASNFKLVPFDETDQQWMLDHLGSAGQIWVTPDSVSMVYEALSSGAIVRVFSLDNPRRRRASRVVSGLDSLIEQSIVHTFDHWKVDPTSRPKRIQFNEAGRVAKTVLEHLL